MPEIDESEIKNLIDKYEKKISGKISPESAKVSKDNASSNNPASDNLSSEFEEFRKEYLPKHMSLYEQACNLSEKILKVAPDKKKILAIEEAINVCHLNITPTGVASFAILGPMVFIVVMALFSLVIFNSMFFVMLFVLVGLGIIFPLGKMPEFLANNWRMKASNQMVLSVFYVVTYMRHTSNLENALRFSADHLTGPLSLDLKKVIWDVETEKYDSVKESLDIYLETWRKWNMEFVEAFHLIESSLFEGSESRRLDLLDKSLSVILDETYEKMLHYAQNLKSPITMLHMLGIILPILGLVILPLVVSFLDTVRWYHIAVLYNVILPITVYYLGKGILTKRPTGYGDVDISEFSPELKKYKYWIINVANTEIRISPLFVSVLVFFIFFFAGTFPLLMHTISPDFDIKLGNSFELFGYRESKDGSAIIGPFGLGATILSFAIPLAFGLALGIYYRATSKNVIKIRRDTKDLEKEFASALFQLGNRLGDGIPAEMAFEKVSYVMAGTNSGNFFSLVSSNIRRLGMDVKSAIYDINVGAILAFPSNIIDTSMRVLIESAKKGPKIAASALLNIARYVKEIHRVDERLKDLLADIISSMKSQIKFLTPAIAGIVIGITSMVTTILGKLGQQMVNLKQGSASSGFGDLFGDGIPTFHFQIIVGIYVVQIIYILTVLANGIENGSDDLNKRYLLGQNLINSTILYCFIALTITLIFNLIASQILSGVLDVM